ncbi:uncharacterized protein PITG_18301 [Phytophthora infestans T30-4]|uniref:RING-type domain-containing protein n=1 Tax=Phytophthora infestans (strain T30-4) TaxID=403677 RepID=D0NXU2_PHYIT|nr:uncharacterized protein PITG_18301 [Phytophthora infestans T30-4]EEY67893.1 conserved hypothetical protein [Phytophthora infestans T30-4]|eukprot:XP_002997755.1 conserved hypothetical protein [Phytophthora infestans T30-4]
MARSDNWSCPICLGRFVRPVLVSCCGQSFCRSCLDDALRQADACPMCRSPLLSGPFSVTSNRALEDALTALDSSSPRRSTTEKRATTSFVDAAERKLTAQMQVSLRRRLRQWELWCRVNWASLQCVFYVALFFVFVSFLRVQEEEFAGSKQRLRRPN